MSVCFLGTILLRVTTEVGWKSCMHDWKSTPLPLLLPGLRGTEDQKDETARSLTERQIRGVTRRKKVRLDLDEDGWRFVQSGQKSAGKRPSYSR